MKLNQTALVFWFLLLTLGFLSPFAAYKHVPAKALDTFGPAPRFMLTDSNGAPFDSNSLNGKVWVINFFFTSCQMICPAMNGRISSVYHEYAKNPGIEFVSVTIDPATDTPPVLSEYAARFHADTATWHFLTGPLASIRTMLDSGFHIASMDDPNVHTTRVVLVDQNGDVRGYYDGSDDDTVQKLSDDIDALLK